MYVILYIMRIGLLLMSIFSESTDDNYEHLLSVCYPQCISINNQ
jgi:hypothetical protein